MLTSRRRALGLIAGVTALCTAAIHASSPKFFQVSTQADFLKGEVENLAIDSHGRLVLGPAIELVYETSAPFVWSVVAGRDGSLFIGTGNEGKVFRIDAQGKGSLFFDAAELEAHALAPAPDGGLYVATSPDGKIYKVDRNGASTEFFDPGENTSGRWPSTRRAICTPAPATKGSSTRSRRTAKARLSTGRRRRTPPRSASTGPAT